jgi:hypothetical protein
VLRALKELLQPGGRIAFTTISITPGLGPEARRHVRSVGPRAVASRASQPGLLTSAGFIDIDEIDITPAFVQTTRAWIDQRAQHADELAALEAPGAFEQRQRDHRSQLAATEDGLLRRTMLSATRP